MLHIGVIVDKYSKTIIVSVSCMVISLIQLIITCILLCVCTVYVCNRYIILHGWIKGQSNYTTEMYP